MLLGNKDTYISHDIAISLLLISHSIWYWITCEMHDYSIVWENRTKPYLSYGENLGYQYPYF